MARLPRLVLPGQAHLMILPGLAGHPVFADDADRSDFLRMLNETAIADQVMLHAFALLDAEVQLLATPRVREDLARWVQSFGRQYVGAHNRRHGRQGTLWAGRFRCAVVEPGPLRLAALQWLDGQRGTAVLTSSGQRLGDERNDGLTDPPEYWALGNTPFEREAAYRCLLEEGVAPSLATALRQAAWGGWALGSEGFVTQVAIAAARPSRPRPRGRPTLKR